MRVGDERVVGPNIDVYSGVVWMISNPGVPERVVGVPASSATRSQSRSYAFLFAALRYGGGVRVADDEPDRHARFSGSSEHFGKSGQAVEQECAAVNQDVDVFDGAAE